MHPSREQAPPQCKLFLSQVGLLDVLQWKLTAQIKCGKANIAVTRANGVPILEICSGVNVLQANARATIV